MNIHIDKDRVRVTESSRQTKISGEGKRRVEKNIVQCAMSLPESSIEIMVVLVFVRSMKMGKITAEEG
jgi:hypothetical protein